MGIQNQFRKIMRDRSLMEAPGFRATWNNNKDHVETDAHAALTEFLRLDGVDPESKKTLAAVVEKHRKTVAGDRVLRIGVR